MKKFVREKTIFSKKLVKTTTFVTALIIASLLLSSSIGAGSLEVTVSNPLKLKIKNDSNTDKATFSIADSTSARYATNVGTSEGGTVPTFSTDILNEGFEGGVIPPTDWTHIQYNPVETWQIDDYDPHSGIYCASCFYDATYTDVQDEWLITPSMDFTPYDEVYLSFWWMMSYYWGVDPYDNYDCNVKVSIDEGTTWTLVWNENAIGTFDNWVWYDTTFGTHIDLSAYTTYSDVLIGFQYEGYDGAQLSIDDVNIYGLTFGEHDVAVESIDSPVSGTGGIIAPKVTVKNYGSNAETFNLNVKIGRYVAPSTIFSYSWETWTTGWPYPGWVVLNPTGGNTWVHYTTYPHTGVGCSRCSYQSPNDDWLISPPKVMPASPVDFSMWLARYSSGTEVASIYYSTTGNTAADFLAGTLLWTGNPPTVAPTYTQYSFSIPESAGTTVWFALRNTGNNQWYIYTDDWTFPDGSTEGFETIPTPNWPDWQSTMVTGTSTYNKWEGVTSGTSPTASPHDGTYMARYYGYLATAGNQARLHKLTPLDFDTGLDIHTMELWMFHDTVAGGAKLEIQASLDGASWTTLETFLRNDGSSGWKKHTIDFSAYGGQTAVYIGFLATSDYNANIYIDDFKIIASGVVWDEYDEDISVSLTSGETKQITCPNWQPAALYNQQDVTITYPIKAEAQLVDDEDLSNNVQQEEFTLYFPFFYDVEIVDLISPASDSDAKPLPVKATLHNKGQYPVRNFFVLAQIGSSTARSVQEDFSTAVVPNMPSGWYTNNAKWSTVASASAGGVSPEARFCFSPSETGDFRMYCDPFNTVGQTTITLTFKHYVSHFAAPYTLKVETSTNGGNTWTYTPWSIDPVASVGPETVTVELNAANAGVGSAQFCISFTFSGYSFNINYWYVDDIVCGTLPPIVDAEYDESTAVTSWIQPCQTVELNWPTWTPANLNYPQESGKIKYTAQVNALLTGDGNLSDNIASKTFKLNYWHDVLVKSVTQPSLGKDNLDWIQYHDDHTENSLGLTAGGTITMAITLTDAELAGFRGWDITPLKASIGSDDYGFYACSYDVWIEPGLPAYGDVYTGGVNIVYSGTSSGTGWDTIDIPAYTIPDTGDVTIGFNIAHSAGQYPCGIDETNTQPAPRANHITYDGYGMWSDLNSLGFPGVWGISVGVEPGGPGPGGINVYIAPGTKPLEAIVKNAGTFAETGLTCYADLYEFVTIPEGNLVYEYDYTGINLDPLGGEKTLGLGSWNFNLEGIYGLYLDLQLGTDNFPNNNQKYYGIGVDNTPPVSTHTLTPASPDGDNEWYVNNVKVKLQAEDPEVNGVASGVKEIKYQVDGGTWQTYTAEFTVTTDGEHTVNYYAVDNVEKQESQKTATFKIDKTKPVIDLSYEVTGGNQWTGWDITFTATPTDATSGIERVEFYLNDVLQSTVPEPGPYQWVIQGYHGGLQIIIKATAFDKAGNSASDLITKIDPAPSPQNQQSQQTQILIQRIQR